MDKQWMQCKDRLCEEYTEGVNKFLDFAFSHTKLGNLINCPCVDCNNVLLKNRDAVKDDLIMKGIVKSYTCWFYHGESILYEDYNDDADDGEPNCDDMFGMLNDAAGPDIFDTIMQDISEQDAVQSNTSAPIESNDEFTNCPEFDRETLKFVKLLEDAKQKLYPNCESFTKLSFIVNLFQAKCLYGLSDKAMNFILKIIKKALPKGETLPNTFYEARKMIRDLGLHYQKIDACENDCMLFWKKNKKLDCCSICGESRWKSIKQEKCGKKVPKKVLRYFPLTPRLQRLFMSRKTAADMRWHHDQRPNDGDLRHPADSEAWKTFDAYNPGFSRDPRNVRLGLSTDGINPFGNMNVSYSTWPVVATVYNLPPWMCMKQPYCLLTLLIPGPKGPGNDIDVYLQPLIEELKELWYNGVDTNDASTKEKFCMRAAILWTISDFPAFAYLSGWSTKGALACPSCNKDTPSYRLKYGRKFCYMRARRFLPITHRWRLNKRAFDGTVEKEQAPKSLTGDDVLRQLGALESFRFGKTSKKVKASSTRANLNWKKRSIFFELPYWRKNLLRHNLDVMHIEKNICESIIGTLLNIDGKTKDGVNARRDLQDMGIKRELHPSQKDGKWYYPPACYTLSSAEKEHFCKFLKQLKVPDRYSSNISRCVNVKERKIYGLKSHDCHILLERLLPLAIRGIVPLHLYNAITELSIFFRELCSKVLKIHQLQRLESQISIILCKLEKIFPPAFFDVMVHLTVHLAGEAILAGPVQYRWMYPIERFLRTLKCYVRNKSKPEGSIAEGYIVEESLMFCSRYLHDVETRFNQARRNYEGSSVSSDSRLSIFKQTGYPLTKDKSRLLGHYERKQAQLYVLKNCEEVQAFIQEYEQGSKETNLIEWFHQRAVELHEKGSDHMNEDLLSLSRGPLSGVKRFRGYMINGYRFHTKQLEKERVTQNCGVFVRGILGTKSVEYFGVLTEIVELQYLGGKRVILFRCDWWDVDNMGRGMKIDKHGFVSVNTSRKLVTDEPFVLASQVQQVFYVEDGFTPNWLVVLKGQPDNIYEFPLNDELGAKEYCNDDDAFQQDESQLHNFPSMLEEEDLLTILHRDDMVAITVDVSPDDHVIVEEETDSEPGTDDEDLLL